MEVVELEMEVVWEAMVWEVEQWVGREGQEGAGKAQV